MAAAPGSMRRAMRAFACRRARSACTAAAVGARAPGYVGFGSFHGENVETLLQRAASGTWTPPPLPPAVAAALELSHPAAAFGAPMRGADFLLSPEWTFLNHGAFGSPCRAAHEAAAAWRLHAERQPLRFIDRELFPQVIEAKRQLSVTLSLALREMVFLPNATSALNIAIHAAAAAASMGEGDELLLLDVGYGSVNKMASRECLRRGGARVRRVPLLSDLPLAATASQVLERVAAAITPRTRVCLFDHITSNTALQLPAAQLAALCRERRVISIVDGAHSIGSVENLRIDRIGADFFCANLHKWMCNPRGSALLHVSGADERLRAAVEPLVVSHGYGEGGLASDFVWQGAGDYSPWLAVPATLRWWDTVGGIDAAAARNRALLAEAAEILQAAWGAPALVAAGSAHCAPTMALLPLPLPERTGGQQRIYTSADGKAVQDFLFSRRIECPVKTVNGRLHVRISAAVYNEVREYDALARTVSSVDNWSDVLP